MTDRVLRIGVVKNGKIILERELAPREPFLHEGHSLFTYGDGYRIELASGMVAHVDPGLSAPTENLTGPHAQPLADTARGKVTAGDCVILFQFKDALPTPVRPELPPEVRSTLFSNIDPQFAGIFAVVALFQLSVVAYARSQPYVEPATIEEAAPGWTKVIMPDRLPSPPKEPAPEAPSATDEQKKAKPVAQKTKPRPGKPGIHDKKSVAKKGVIAAIGKAGSGNGAVKDLFAEGGVSTSLEMAFTGIEGVTLAENDGGARRRPGDDGPVDIEGLSTQPRGPVEGPVKTETRVEGDAVPEGPPEVDGGLTPAQVARVMGRHVGALKACYEAALKRDRRLAGKLVIRFEVNHVGRTSDVGFGGSLGSSAVERCVAKRAKYWRFPKNDGSVFVEYPILFTPSGT